MPNPTTKRTRRDAPMISKSGKPANMNRYWLVRGLILPILALFLFAGPAFADDKEQLEAAKAFIEGLEEKMVTRVIATDMTQQEKVDQFRRYFSDAVDLEIVGRFVLGRYWRAASAEERQNFMDAFKDLTIATWSRRFKDYSGQELVVTGIADSARDDIFVESEVRQNDQKPIPVTWRVKPVNDGFKVVDIIVEGVSMALTYRDEYTAVIRNQGSVSALVDLLRAKYQEVREPAG